jgi:hypothetical protein
MPVSWSEIPLRPVYSETIRLLCREIAADGCNTAGIVDALQAAFGRSQGAMTKIGGVKRQGLFTRELSGERRYFIFEITRGRYQQGGRDLAA